MYIGIQLRLASFCLFTIFELLSSIGKERKTFYSRVVKPLPIVPVIQQKKDGFYLKGNLSFYDIIMFYAYMNKNNLNQDYEIRINLE